MSNIPQINNINFESILQKLWIRYVKKWNNANLYHDWRLTWWLVADLSRGFVTDFSEKNRPQWDRIKFTQEYLKITSERATIEWFEENFNIKNTYSKTNTMKLDNPIKDKFNNLPWISKEQEEYLLTRWINSELLWDIIRDYKWNIALPISSLDNIKSIQSRSIKEWWSRYYIEWNTDSDWLFIHWLDSSKSALIVVEWFTDFLTLRQYTTNVVWLVNAKNEEQIKMIKHLGHKYKIFFIPDNDEAWNVTIEKFNSLWIKFNQLKLIDYWVKDINELAVKFGFWKELLEIIFLESERSKTTLSLAMDKAKWYHKLYKENDWHLWFSSWYKYIDKYTDWIIKWKTYLVMAFSNLWKTRFAYSLARNCLLLKKRVHFYSLEVDSWMLFLEIVWVIKWMTKQEVMNNIDNIDIKDYEDYLEVYDDIRSLEAIERNVMNEKPDVIFIDFVQNIEHNWSEYEKMTEIALRLQKLAIMTWTTIISLSQVWNESRFLEWSMIMPKWSWALFASSDVIFSLRSKEWEKYFTISKNKYWPANKTFWLNIDYEKSIFNMSEDFEEIQPVKKFKTF